jgi:predicted branched-subunit amino acid permease
MINTSTSTFRRAARDALGFPSIMLLASMTGFGSLARESGLTVGMALTTTAGIWGLPGQVALAELHAAGVPVLFVILASSLANARFMPMAVSFIPLMRAGVKNFGWMFVLVQLLSINSWAAGQRSFPDIIPEMRARYYVVFALICMTAGLIGTAIGFYGVGVMSRPAALGLIFLNPLFFAVLIAGTRVKPAMIAIIVGAPLGPIFHMISPDWGLLATGIAGGTLAFWIHRRRPGAGQ